VKVPVPPKRDEVELPPKREGVPEGLVGAPKAVEVGLGVKEGPPDGNNEVEAEVEGGAVPNAELDGAPKVEPPNVGVVPDPKVEVPKPELVGAAPKVEVPNPELAGAPKADVDEVPGAPKVDVVELPGAPKADVDELPGAPKAVVELPGAPKADVELPGAPKADVVELAGFVPKAELEPNAAFAAKVDVVELAGAVPKAEVPNPEPVVPDPKVEVPNPELAGAPKVLEGAVPNDVEPKVDVEVPLGFVVAGVEKSDVDEESAGMDKPPNPVGAAPNVLPPRAGAF